MAETLTVSPTRMELMKMRRRAGLAQRGHDLLKEKMDALVAELFDVLRRIKDTRAEALERLARSHLTLTECFASMGTLETMQAARETGSRLQFEISTRSVMGVTVPVVELGDVKRSALTRGYGLSMTSPLLDEAAAEFERSLATLVELAEEEAVAFAIARELERTKRRVNALEQILLPKLKEGIKFIMMRLDEIERENFTRLKRIKAVIEEGE